MNIYSISSIVGSSICFFLATFVYLKGRLKHINESFAIVTVLIGIWTFFPLLSSLSYSDERALFFVRIIYIAAIFVPSTYLKFMLYIMKLSADKKDNSVLRISYFISIFFTIFVFSPLFIKSILRFQSELSLVPGPLYIGFILYFGFMYFYAASKLLTRYKKSIGYPRIQLKYVGLAFFIAFISGVMHFLSAFGVKEIFPHDILVVTYNIIMVYAILKFRLMDINVALTRIGIFIAVYLLVLGIPFWIAAKMFGWGGWIIPVSIMGIFATAGPFIYFYIQKRAENALLQEQRAYHAALRQASAGMGRIKDLDKLLNMIVYILTQTVKIEHAVVYIHDQVKKVYKLGAYKHRSNHAIFPPDFPQQHPAVDYLHKDHEPIVFEEIKQKALDYQDQQLLDVGAMMQNMEAALLVPIYIGDQMMALVGMGKKENDKLYTEDDLSVFSILANQAALAIENAQFYEDMKLTQQQLFQAEKMATIGTMADGLSHQINNRLHAMGFIAGDALDTIKLNKDLQMPDKIKEMIAGLEKGLVRIQENVTQGGDVVRGLLKYTRKGETGLGPVDVDTVVTSAYEMAQFKIKTYQMDLVRDYDKNTLPKVKGNSTQLQEVFFNLIDNGYDAMVQRQNELKNPQFHPTLIIHAQVQGDFLQMVFEDNGIGVKGEDVQKLFTPFFTTKLSSKKGTGLGLYVIRKIIEENHGGKVEFVSKYRQGTQMKLLLPISL